jgi:hypothetical protein
MASQTTEVRHCAHCGARLRTLMARFCSAAVSEPRTPRDMRLAIREAEETLRLFQEADMMAGDWEADWSLNAARAKLRKAERHFAKKDQHPDVLKPLSPRVRPRPVSTQPNRRRYRCTGCFIEQLFHPEHIGFDGMHYRIEDTLVAEGDPYLPRARAGGLRRMEACRPDAAREGHAWTGALRR